MPQPCVVPPGRGSSWRAGHLVEVSELSGAVAVQVEAIVVGEVQGAVPGFGAVNQHQIRVGGEQGGEVAATAEGRAALLHGCVAEVLEVLEGDGAVGSAEGEVDTRDMALVPAGVHMARVLQGAGVRSAVGEGGCRPAKSSRKALKT